MQEGMRYCFQKGFLLLLVTSPFARCINLKSSVLWDGPPLTIP